MWREVDVTIREFCERDIPKKVEWINNPDNNRFLHYDIPICVEKTEKWFQSHRGDDSRYDAVIEVDGEPVGTIGLLNISQKDQKAEFYIAMGEVTYKGRGVARTASQLMLKHGFKNLKLNRVYLYTETKNIVAQRLFERVGFVREGLLRDDILSHGELCDRYVYSILREEWEQNRG